MYSRTLVCNSSDTRRLFSLHVSASGRGAERLGLLLLRTSFLSKKEVVNGGAFRLYSTVENHILHRRAVLGLCMRTRTGGLQQNFPYYFNSFDQNII